MVRITKVHTGGGDGGNTSLASGDRVSKSHPRLETRHHDGGLRATVRRARNAAKPKLALLQQELFDVGGECAFPPGTVPEYVVIIGDTQADRLCEEMDAWTADLPALESFILPTGSPLVASMHLARTVARRAERCAMHLRDADGEEAVRDLVLAYLNRLSDWFFVLGRWITAVLGEDEVLWQPLGERHQA
jgi:cob(I)alamin adenosyltransferase